MFGKWYNKENQTLSGLSQKRNRVWVKLSGKLSLVCVSSLVGGLLLISVEHTSASDDNVHISLASRYPLPALVLVHSFTWQTWLGKSARGKQRLCGLPSSSSVVDLMKSVAWAKVDKQALSYCLLWQEVVQRMLGCQTLFKEPTDLPMFISHSNRSVAIKSH